MYRHTTSVSMAALLALLFTVSACSDGAREKDKDARKRESVSLTHTLEMVDDQNRHYGTVELSPLGNGKVYDANGRVIGEIIPPERSYRHDRDRDRDED